MTFLYQFGAEAAASGGGLSMLGINLQGFLFQLITFVLVLLLLNKYVYKQLVETLETRRKAVIGSLDDAKKAADALEKTNKNAVINIDQTNNGNECIPIPATLILKIVVIKFIEPNNEAAPAKCKLKIAKSTPSPSKADNGG